MAKIMTPYQNDIKRVSVPSFDILRGANILVTGATGLVGSAIVDLLMCHAEKGEYDVYAGCRTIKKFDSRFSEEENKNRLHYIQVDVTKPFDSNIRFDYIIHAASGADPRSFSMDPVGVMKANLLGVMTLLDYGVEHGLKRFVFVSSGEVYGEGCDGEWRENDSGYVDSMSVRSCYPSSKRAAETLCVAYSQQFRVECLVARLCHTYGPNFTDTDNRVYAQFIRNVLNREDIVMKSNGEQYRSWLYVVDCVSALFHILINGKDGEAYNVASRDSNITIKDLAEIIAKSVGRKVVIDIPRNGIINTHPITKAVFDTSKIESLGWKPSFGIEQGLINTIKSRE